MRMCSQAAPRFGQVMRYESAGVKESAGLDPTALSPTNPREKWLRKRTQVKLRVSSAGQLALGAWAAIAR